MAEGLPGDFGSMESLPEGMMLRRMLNPAPLAVPNNMFSACWRVALLALRMELAWPNASETPNPSMRWNVVPGSIATVVAALAVS
ncbi:hypothetical protein GCM10018954_098210 [Kutzneria kofuensis]